MEGLKRAADDVVRCLPRGWDATRKPSLAAVVCGQVATVWLSTDQGFSPTGAKSKCVRIAPSLPFPIRCAGLSLSGSTLPLPSRYKSVSFMCDIIATCS